MPNVILSWEEGRKKYGSELLERCMEKQYNLYIGLRMTAHEKAQKLIDILKDADRALGMSDCEERHSENVKYLIETLERI